MQQITILSIGKNKTAWLDEALSEYVKRLKSAIELRFVIAKDDRQLIQLAEKAGFCICLDEKGDSLASSEAFAKRFAKDMERSGSRLTYIIGGADGLPKELRERYPLLSLSPLTLTHQMVRLLLVEQIYRAWEILRGSAYHRA